MAMEKCDLRMGCDQKGGLVKKSLGDTGLPKPAANPALKPMAQKGIMGKSGSMGLKQGPSVASGTSMAGTKHSLKGFTSGGKVQP